MILELTIGVDGLPSRPRGPDDRSELPISGDCGHHVATRSFEPARKAGCSDRVHKTGEDGICNCRAAGFYGTLRP